MIFRIKFIALILFTNFFALSSWAQMDTIRNQKEFVFPASMKRVWKATQFALNTYPLDTNDMSSGLIKTQPLKPEQVWLAPFEKKLPTNYRQTFTIRFVKLDSRNTKMLIEKNAEVQTDFFGSTVKQFSSGWEELRLYYKIRRELEIEKVLSRLN